MDGIDFFSISSFILGWILIFAILNYFVSIRKSSKKPSLHKQINENEGSLLTAALHNSLC